MLVIVTVVEKITSSAHINMPNGLSEIAIKQHITDLYNSGEIQSCFEVSEVEMSTINARIIQQQDLTISTNI